MALVHEQWMDEMFANMSINQMDELMQLLTKLHHSIEAHPD